MSDSTVCPGLLNVSEIVSCGLSDALLQKKKQAEKLLIDEAKANGMPDPHSVSVESAKLVLNVLYKYSGLKDVDFHSDTAHPLTKKLKGRDAVSGIITGLRWVYREHGHTDQWQVRVTGESVKVAHGNPLEGNNLIKEFRKIHSKRLSEIGNVVKTAPPLCAEHIIEHGKRFMISSSPDTVERIDVMLHAFLLTAMNCGMRYDELSKVRMENVKISKYGCEFGIDVKCKNSTSYRGYQLRRWPGDALSKSLLMDPLFALAAWVYARGNLDGFLFCNIVRSDSSSRMILEEPWPRKSFVSFMQERFRDIGFGSGVLNAHTGHSPKRGGVQLLRFLGCKDTFIMKWFGMTGQIAYLRYTEGFNDARGTAVPDFASSSDLQAHAIALKDLEQVLESEDMNEVSDWLSESAHS